MAEQSDKQSNDPFLSAFRGYLRSLLKWQELEQFWSVLRDRADAGWYIYAVGEAVPTEPASAPTLRTFVDEIDALLRREHDEDYCGIVYVDDVQRPTLVKIYDPNNLGSVCGPGSLPPPLPGWVLSTMAPSDLQALMPPPGNRRRWWQRLFG